MITFSDIFMSHAGPFYANIKKQRFPFFTLKDGTTSPRRGGKEVVPEPILT